MKLKSNLLPPQKDEPVILIVDDNPTNLGVLADYLEDFDFEVIMAVDGEDGLETAIQTLPDIILLDVMMPKMDGFEACKCLKANKTTRHIPIIFMTALTSEADKVQAFKAGGVDYITKPIYQEEVLARINTHLHIQRQAKALKTEVQNKDKLLSIIAHDLKGPFTPLLTFLEHLTEQADQLNRKEIKQLSTNSYQSAKSIYNLLENLLEWTRLQRKNINYVPFKLELNQMVQQNMTILKANAHHKNIKLQNKIPAPLHVHADEYMLNTIIRNLIANAIKFTPINGKITALASPHPLNNELIEIAIVDTGIGISADNIKKLFSIETHYTTYGTNQEKGTGLGLMMCKEMVEINGGQIWIESKVGTGTTVKFTLPLEDKTQTGTEKALDNKLTKQVEDTLPLIPPPQDRLEALLDLTIRGNMKQLKEMLDDIEQEDEQFKAFVAKTRQLANGFEDEEIFILIQGFLKK